MFVGGVWTICFWAQCSVGCQKSITIIWILVQLKVFSVFAALPPNHSVCVCVCVRHQQTDVRLKAKLEKPLLLPPWAASFPSCSSFWQFPIVVIESETVCVQPQSQSEWNIKKVKSIWNYHLKVSRAMLLFSTAVNCERCFWHSQKSSNYGGVRSLHLLTKLRAASSADGFRCSLSIFPLNFPVETRLHAIVCSPLCDEPVTCQLGSAQRKRINDPSAGSRATEQKVAPFTELLFTLLHFLFLPAIISINVF